MIDLTRNPIAYANNKDELSSSKKNSILRIEQEIKVKQYADPDSKYIDPLEEKLDNFYLPTAHLAKDNQVDENQIFDSLLEKKKYPWWAWIVAIIALINSGFLGPFLLLVDAGTIVKAGWRQLMTGLLIIPFIILDYKKGENNLYSREIVLNFGIIKKMIIASIFHSLWIISFAYSIDYTSMTHVYILNNLDVFINCFFKLFRRDKISRFEKTGFVMTLLGIVLLYIDQDFEFFEGGTFSSGSFLKGNTVALLGSITGALYLLSCLGITEEYPSWLGITIINLFSAFNQLIFAMIFNGASFDTDVQNGIFGLFTMKWFFVHIGISLLTGIGCYCLLIILSGVFIPLHYNFILHLEPTSGALMTFFLGLQSLPGVTTWISMIIIIIALTMISIGRNQSDLQDIDFDDVYFNANFNDKEKFSAGKRNSGLLLGRESNIEFKLFNSKRTQKNP